MSNKSIPRLSAGFTIIEVILVLAIAGVIMMIVFQAIPTLQRNSRNSQRKNEVSAVLSAVSRYQARNSGDFPVCVESACQSLILSTVKLNFYENRVTVTADYPSIVQAGPSSDEEAVNVYNYHKCHINTSTGQAEAVTTAAGYFDIVAVYFTENGNGDMVFRCQEL